jgi:hypothetical protein
MSGGTGSGDATAGANPEEQPQAFDWKSVGKGFQTAGQQYAQGASQGQSNYQSGSGSPWIGAGKVLSADQPTAYQIPQTAPNQVSDFQKQYYDIVGKIYQSYQQRVMNEGFGQQQQVPGGFSF